MTEPGGPGTPMSERMQSLLSRAAEDQLTEQRQIAGVLTDLRAQVQRITVDLAALREQSQTPAGSGDALSTVSADLREAVRLIGERIDAVARLVQQRGNDLVELRGLIEQTQGAVQTHGQALGGLSSGLSALPAFGERIGGLQDNLNALHERLAGLDALAGSLGALQQRVDGVDQGLRDLRSAFAAIGARMAELPGRPDIEAMADRSGAPLAELRDRIGGLEQAVSAVAAQLTAATEDSGRVDEDEPGQRIDELRAELARFAAAAREDSEDLARRLSALDLRMSELLDAVVPEETEHADEAADATGEEEYVEDPVLTELADLREALLGDDGLAAQVEAARDAVSGEDLDTRVTAAVENAVAASEERLAAHIDEAVLALAEALLRRRSGARPASTPVAAQPPTSQSASAAPVTAGAAATDGDDEDAFEDEDEEAPAAAGAHSDEPADEPESEEPAAMPAWQTPRVESGTEPSGGEQWPPTQPAEEANRRRRPWWRPGD